MNKIIKVLTILCLTVLVVSCKKETKQSESKPSVVLAENVKTVNLSIKGMTCEIGCAKTIESKISKLNGVTDSKVNFEAKKGTFTYDSSQTSEKEIADQINGLLDGKTYLAEVLSTKSCKMKCDKSHCDTKDKKECAASKKECCTTKK